MEQETQYSEQEPERQTTTLAGVLDEIGRSKQKRTRVKSLKKFESFALLSLLQGNFNESITFPFPSGAPPFEKNETLVEPTKNVISNLGDCTTKASGTQVSKERKFITLLESVHFRDAELFCLMKDGELESQYPWLTRELVSEAFPTLL